jgi:hypothetical protein
MQKPLIQFIPIILLVIVLVYPKPSASFSSSILGKILAIIIVIFYTSVDKLYGALACAFIVIYYQSGHIEGMDTYCAKPVVTPKKTEDTIIPQEPTHIGKWHYTATSVNDMNLGNPSKEENCHIEGMTSLETTDVSASRTSFQEKNCSGGKLKYKGVHVKNEMADHVFPEIEFTDIDTRCNPCDSTCSYGINAKLALERDIVTPKESKEIPKSMWERTNHFAEDPVKSVRVASEPFSFIQ